MPIDQLGRSVDLAATPARICSLCPSTTETLFELGVGGSVVGRTDYCCMPPGDVDAIASVGGTKRVRVDRVAALDPDLIVAVREENDRAQVEELAQRWPVFVLDPVDVSSAIAGVRLLGGAVGRVVAGEKLAAEIEAEFAMAAMGQGARVVYLIWRKPFMAAGAGTYLDDVLQRLGFANPVRELDGRYPEVEVAWLRDAGVDFLFASSEPFPFEAKHLAELAELAPGARPVLVDGAAFSWHGARMRHAAPELRRLTERLLAEPRKPRPDPS